MVASAAPSISTATRSENGRNPGDIVISMPQSLANRAQEIIKRESSCSKLRKRALDLKCVSGATEALIVNAQPGGALNDLLFLRGPGPQFGAADVARALTTAIQFARNFAPVLKVDPETAANFGAIAFSMAYEVLYHHMVLSTNNVISASQLRTGTTSVCSATKTATDCDVGCSMIGAIQFCSTTCTRTTTGCSATGKIRTTGWEGLNTGPIQKPTAQVPVTPTATAKADAAPTPTASILIIWDVPPKTGQPFYDFYQAPAGFAKSLDNSCGSKKPELMPFSHIGDPKQGRIDKIRPKSVTRQAPGKLGPLKGVQGNCVYEESSIGAGRISCDKDVKITCTAPRADLAKKISPNNGACGDVKDVRTLVMVCAPFHSFTSLTTLLSL